MTLHGDLREYGPQQRLKWRHAAFAIAIKRSSLEQIHQELGEDVPPRVGLAPMGADPAFFRRTENYAPWKGIGPLRLFSVGRLNPAKGHKHLIEAISLLKKSGMALYLEIAGEDEEGGKGYHRELDKLIVSLELTDDVVLLGAVDEARVLEGLTTAHLFVLASLSDPLPVAIMEAMSCETPILATNSGGVPELIEHGVDGYLVPPENPSALAEAIAYLANNPNLAEQFSTSARSKVLQRFNSSLSAKAISRLLEEMKDPAAPFSATPAPLAALPRDLG
jgi:glycosyltransferase involved in cell wall biosynthesis